MWTRILFIIPYWDFQRTIHENIGSHSLKKFLSGYIWPTFGPWIPELTLNWKWLSKTGFKSVPASIGCVFFLAALNGYKWSFIYGLKTGPFGLFMNHLLSTRWCTNSPVNVRTPGPTDWTDGSLGPAGRSRTRVLNKIQSWYYDSLEWDF